ncbi:TetR/AcrR family transcriptional regulator C-terminal domain-containing protein [Arthrobacter sp. BHU FT2]|nr:TetR/AcrR family transcriptional regulator C-terminal domain-containing protein [Arthrobacter sp. BHU FT2]
MASPREPRSPRPGPQRQGPPLNRQRVISAALEVIDAEGVTALTMRRLGRELGTDPMNLYRHTKNRCALLDAVAEHVMDDLPVLSGDAEWKGQLRLLAHELRLVALRHPNLAPLLLTQPLSTPLGLRPPGTLRPLENILSLLTAAGFAPADTARVYRAFQALLCGHIIIELQKYIVDPDEDEPLLRLGLQRLPARAFPQLRALAPALAQYDGASELDQSLDILLTGLETQLGLHPPAGSFQENTPQTSRTKGHPARKGA